MSKTSTDPMRHALNGPTMGTRWSALFYTEAGFDPEPVRNALQAEMDEVDAQMSTWKPDSALMTLNAGPVGDWIEVPARLADVLRLALEIGRASGGAFDIGVGDAVDAWGFGPQAADRALIQKALARSRQPAHAALELNPVHATVRKRAPIAIDLNGIAKGYGVDRLAAILGRFSITSGLAGIDGEMRALGLRPGGEPWNIAIESPTRPVERRTPSSPCRMLRSLPLAITDIGLSRTVAVSRTPWIRAVVRRCCRRPLRLLWSRKPVLKPTPGRPR